MSHSPLIPFSTQQKRVLLVGYAKQLRANYLTHVYDADDILSEVCIRLNEATEQGTVINSPYMWAKIVGKNLIIDYIRDDVAQKNAIRSMKVVYDYQCLSVCCEEGRETIVLRKSMNILQTKSKDDYDILYLYFFIVSKPKRWRKVTQILLQKENVSQSEINCKRKAGNRALNKLRKIFYKELDRH